MSDDPREPIMLTPEEESDVYALILWAFMSKPGIPTTGVLRALYARLNKREHER